MIRRKQILLDETLDVSVVDRVLFRLGWPRCFAVFLVGLRSCFPWVQLAIDVIWTLDRFPFNTSGFTKLDPFLFFVVE